MANFDFDQAEGLRRMLAGPKPRIVTFLSATPQDDKGAMLVNLGASLARAGNDVVLVDACASAHGVASRLGIDNGASLLNVARQECALNEVIHAVPQGFNVVSMTRGEPRNGPQEARRLAKAFDVLAAQAGIVLVDGEFDGAGVPTLYRVHEDPDPLKVEQFEEFVKHFGYSLNAGRRDREFHRGTLGELDNRPLIGKVLELRRARSRLATWSCWTLAGSTADTAST